MGGVRIAEKSKHYAPLKKKTSFTVLAKLYASKKKARKLEFEAEYSFHKVVSSTQFNSKKLIMTGFLR